MKLRALKRPLLVLAGFFVVAQLYRPARTNPPVNPANTLQARMQVPPPVQEILAKACQDCHSNQTVWPWYSNVAPVSWLLVSHVNGARSHMDFSDWAQLEALHKATGRLTDICSEVQSGGMPLSSYKWLHPSARLSPQDSRTLCDWTATAAHPK